VLLVHVELFYKVTRKKQDLMVKYLIHLFVFLAPSIYDNRKPIDAEKSSRF
jgi:hypothetical protein